MAENTMTPLAGRPGAFGQGVSSQRASPTTSPPLGSAPRPSISRSPASNPNFSNLPPLVTSTADRRISSTRIPSYASKRLSTFSNASGAPPRSRPGSTGFPAFHSSLPYALVRDFAYEPTHILHYGPPPDPSSAASTNVSDFPHRLSDTIVVPSQGSRTPWSGHPGNAEAGLYGGPQLPATSFADGPPWREDEDLLSPIVSTRHRKVKSSDVDYFGSREWAGGTEGRRASYAGRNQDGTHDYYINDVEADLPDGPGGEIVTLTKPDDRYTHEVQVNAPHGFAYTNGNYLNASHVYDDEENRFSKDYSFSIASPDEEMHGKAVALFDFESENNNELPLKEGQVLWVSYRHGEGWLVAKDPSTGEDGLVPEAFVRLERDIQGGFRGLNGQAMNEAASPIGPDTPTLASMVVERVEGADQPGGSGLTQYPMVSHFTTSSRDLLPHDTHTHTPISTTSPLRPFDPQFEGASRAGSKQSPSSPEDASGSEEPETDEDEDDTQPVLAQRVSATGSAKG